MNRLEKVIASNMCAGCGLCVGSTDEMKIDDKGFVRPKKQIFDELSNNACPSIKIVQNNLENYNASWGPILSCQTGFSSNPKIRQMGSSGGVITALLYMLLSEKLVDAVIQTGTSKINPIANETKIIFHKEELILNSGSRYAPSSPLSVIRSIKGDGNKYAFVGKPCDAAALRMAVQRDNELQKQFPIILSFMCAGVPSELAAKEVINKFGLQQKNVTEFRYRGDGWPGLTKAVTSEGDVKTMTYNESWGTILNKHLQARCKVCADGTGELADIVCADAWYESKDGYPSFEETEGRSLIIVRTTAGRDLLSQAISLNYIKGLEKFNITGLRDIQPYQYNRKRTLIARILALKLLLVKTPKYKGFSLMYLLFRTPPIQTFKAMVGTCLRKLKGRF